MAIMGRDPFGIIKEGEVHTISYRKIYAMVGLIVVCPGQKESIQNGSTMNLARCAISKRLGRDQASR